MTICFCCCFVCFCFVLFVFVFVLLLCFCFVFGLGFFFFFLVFNPTIKLATFRFRGWCMLGVILLPALTRLEHERQDLLSPCDGIMHVCTD